MLRARATLDLADALDGELARDGEPATAAGRRRAAAGRGAGRDGAHRHRRRHRLPDRAGGALRRRGEGGGRRRRTPWSAASSTSARPSSCRRSCSTSWTCPRRSGSRPATPPTPTRCSGCSRRPAPAAGAPAAPPRRGQAQVHGRRAAQVDHDDGRIHTTFYQTVAATGRLSSHRPQPAEHPDPHRGGPADPPGVRGRRGLRVAADRRLQPDRDAHHGAPVRGRGADRRVQVRRGPPHHHRVLGLRDPARRGRPPSSGARSRRCLRPGVRAVRYGLSQQLGIPPTRRAG